MAASFGCGRGLLFVPSDDPGIDQSTCAWYRGRNVVCGKHITPKYEPSRGSLWIRETEEAGLQPRGHCDKMLLRSAMWGGEEEEEAAALLRMGTDRPGWYRRDELPFCAYRLLMDVETPCGWQVTGEWTTDGQAS